ncbi:LytR/AlgR family response regulator transcription factor [Psychroserpens ponticola]|uniref:Response regulator n=1 Tax=Psychroserpens ponticola TaxID=2932268 RepID=A0ABY7S1B7_9FLAO|nr:response regulator [Psychroserpens ponticola]WCO03191.1 response regulator [Psychroserpens ponticola]
MALFKGVHASHKPNPTIHKIFSNKQYTIHIFTFMAEIKAVLIDDEPSAISVLANLLKRTSSNINIVATCNNLEDGVEQIKKLQPNAVFLDVQMPNYAGYEIVEFFDIINFDFFFYQEKQN